MWQAGPQVLATQGLAEALVKLARVHHCFNSLRDLIVISALALTGTYLHAQLPASLPDQVLEASGNVPVWSLRITNATLELQIEPNPPEPPIRVVTTAPPAVHTDPGRSSTASAPQGEIKAVFTRNDCTDAVSGSVHPETVSLSVGGKTYFGCSGNPASLLQGAAWVVFDIATRGVEADSRVTLQFSDTGEVSGVASCHHFEGQYRADDDGLRITAATTTRVSSPAAPSGSPSLICPPALRRQEAAFMKALADITRWDFTADGALALGTVDGRRILARRN